MNEPTSTQSTPAIEKMRAPAPGSSRGLFAVLIIIVAGFSLPLLNLAKLALSEDLYSHVLLIPIVSLYLIWAQRKTWPENAQPERRLAVILAVTGLAIIVYAWTSPSVIDGPENYLASRILAFFLLVNSACAWFLGRQRLRVVAFPLLFFIFMVPFSTAARHGLETFLQHGSAAVAHGLFKISGTTVFYEDLIFRLPGINLEVAPECSGIRSSLALFITSVLAGHFFLRSPWRMAVLSLAVIPLALLRNGFRVFTIGELCVQISPDMIDSYIHHKGGPIFFALSLIPFFLLLRFLYKSEQRASAKRTIAS